MIKGHDRVVLVQGLPDHGLEEGDVGTVVFVHAGGIGYEVEFVTLDGSSSSVIEVTAGQVRSVGSHEIPHARSLTTA